MLDSVDDVDWLTVTIMTSLHMCMAHLQYSSVART